MILCTLWNDQESSNKNEFHLIPRKICKEFYDFMRYRKLYSSNSKRIHSSRGGEKMATV